MSTARSRATHAIASVLAALCGSLLLLFLAAPIAELVTSGGIAGARKLGTDTELRSALLLTAATATSATVLGVFGGTPLAYLLARASFRGRAVVAALLDLPLLIPHPVAGIALLLLFNRSSPLGATLLELGVRAVGSPVGIVFAIL